MSEWRSSDRPSPTSCSFRSAVPGRHCRFRVSFSPALSTHAKASRSAPSAPYTLSALEVRAGCGQAIIAANASGLWPFSVLGIWSHGESAREYVDDVLCSLKVYDDILRGGPTVVMGDLNSGPCMDRPGALTSHHSRLLAAFAALDMVSAYHVFNGVEHGAERHLTYRDKSRGSTPWHIDFCLVPLSWAGAIRHVELLDEDAWRAQSDHHPLLVELQFA